MKPCLLISWQLYITCAKHCACILVPLVKHVTCSDVPGCLLGVWRSTFRLCAAVGWPTELEKCHQIRSMSSAHLLCSGDD